MDGGACHRNIVRRAVLRAAVRKKQEMDMSSARAHRHPLAGTARTSRHASAGAHASARSSRALATTPTLESRQSRRA